MPITIIHHFAAKSFEPFFQKFRFFRPYILDFCWIKKSDSKPLWTNQLNHFEAKKNFTLLKYFLPNYATFFLSTDLGSTKNLLTNSIEATASLKDLTSLCVELCEQLACNLLDWQAVCNKTVEPWRERRDGRREREGERREREGGRVGYYWPK